MMAKKNIKPEARILGIDDGPFDKLKKGEVLVVGTVFRGGQYPDAVLSTKVQADGNDATDRIIGMVRDCRQRKQLHAIMVKGIALGGFNVIDIAKLSGRLKIPVVVVIRSYPDFRKIEEALLKRVEGGSEKLGIIRRTGKPVPVIVKGKRLYMQFSGLSEDKAKELVLLTATRSHIPEPIRLSHMIAAGIVLGRSSGQV